MRCPNCNHLNRSVANVCSQCGTRLTASPLKALGPLLQNRYRLDRKLGKGGMGEVYLATDTRINRQIVIKEMLALNTPQEQQEAEKNFRLEAQVLAGLHHAHIPDIKDYFSEGGKYYLVMEWINGEDLEKRLEKEGAPLPENDALRYALQVLDVLEYLAQQQPPVIHRDIKPANIIVDQNDNVYLVDFGIARAKPTQSGVTSRDTSLYGTKGYAPPEQYAGKTEPRSDVYALGATMHHLLTNRDPRDPQHKNFIGLTKLVPTISPALAQLVHQMLDDNMTRRPTAVQVRQQLQALSHPQSIVIQGKNHPLVFQGNDIAYTVPDLVRLCDKYWSLAIQYLKRHHIEKWLTEIGRPDLATRAAEIRLEVNRRKKTTDPNEALERLLCILDPARTQLVLTVSPAMVNVAVAKGTPVVFTVNLTCNSLVIKGTISVEPSDHTIAPTNFDCKAPTFSETLTLALTPSTIVSGSQVVRVHFRKRYAQATIVLKYNIIAPLLLGTAMVMQLDDLVPAAIANWSNALVSFQNGELNTFLQACQRPDLINRARQLAPREEKSLVDLLYQIQPTLPQAKLIVTPAQLDFGTFTRGIGNQILTRELQVTLKNDSDGIAYHEVKTLETFVTVMPNQVLLLPRQTKTLHVRVSATNLSGTASGQLYSSRVEFHSPTRIANLPITWRVIVPPIQSLPVLAVTPSAIKLNLANRPVQSTIEIFNQGGSTLIGTITFSAAWLKPLATTSFSLAPNQMTPFAFQVEPTFQSITTIIKYGSIWVRSNGGAVDVAVIVEQQAIVVPPVSPSAKQSSGVARTRSAPPGNTIGQTKPVSNPMTIPSSKGNTVPGTTSPPTSSTDSNPIGSDRIVKRSIRAGAVVVAASFFVGALVSGANAGVAFIISVVILGIGLLIAAALSRMAIR